MSTTEENKPQQILNLLKGKNITEISSILSKTKKLAKIKAIVP